MLSKTTTSIIDPGWCNRGTRCALRGGTLRLQFLCQGRGTRSASGLVSGLWATLVDRDTRPRRMVSGHTAIGTNAMLELQRTKVQRTVSISCRACGYRHVRAQTRIIPRLGSPGQHQRLMLSKPVLAILDLTAPPRLVRRPKVCNLHLSISGTSPTTVCALTWSHCIVVVAIDSTDVLQISSKYMMHRSP